MRSYSCQRAASACGLKRGHPDTVESVSRPWSKSAKHTASVICKTYFSEMLLNIYTEGLPYLTCCMQLHALQLGGDSSQVHSGPSHEERLHICAQQPEHALHLLNLPDAAGVSHYSFAGRHCRRHLLTPCLLRAAAACAYRFGFLTCWKNAAASLTSAVMYAMANKRQAPEGWQACRCRWTVDGSQKQCMCG